MENLSISNVSTDRPASINSTAPYGISQVENWILLVVFFGLIGGLLNIFFNAAMLIGIIRDQALRTRFYIILSFLLFSRVAEGVQIFINFVYRSLLTSGVIGSNMILVSCYFLQMTSYYALTLDMVFLLGLVVDRTLAIIAYKYYRLLTYKQAMKTCLIATVITVITKLTPSFFGIDFTAVIPCLNAYSPISFPYRIYHNYSDFTLGILTLAAYLGLIIYIRYQFLPKVTGRLTGPDRDQVFQSAINQHKKLLPILSRLVLVHCGFSVFNRAFIASGALLPASLALKVANYGVVPLVMDYLINIIVLIVSDVDLRKASFPCFTGSSTTLVVSIQIQSSVQRARRDGNTNNAGNIPN